jgi:VanZ family protein
VRERRVSEPRVLCRVLGGIGVVAIAVVSLIPGDVQVRTPLPRDLEHFAAYMLTGGVLAMGFASPPTAILIACFLAFEAAVMESLQEWIPGRYSSFDTALISAAGGILGAMAGGVLQALVLAENDR